MAAGAQVAGSVQRLPHPALRFLVTRYRGYRYDGLEPGVRHGLPLTDLTAVLALDAPADVAWRGDEASRGRRRARPRTQAGRPGARVPAVIRDQSIEQ